MFSYGVIDCSIEISRYSACITSPVGIRQLTNQKLELPIQLCLLLGHIFDLPLNCAELSFQNPSLPPHKSTDPQAGCNSSDHHSDVQTPVDANDCSALLQLAFSVHSAFELETRQLRQAFLLKAIF